MGHDPRDAELNVLKQVVRETMTALDYLNTKLEEVQRRVNVLLGGTTVTSIADSSAYARGRAAVTGGVYSGFDDDLNDDPAFDGHGYPPGYSGSTWRGYSGNGYNGGGGGYNRGNTPLWTPPRPKTGIVGADLGTAVNREVKEIASAAPAKSGSFWDDVEPDDNVPLGAEDEAPINVAAHHAPSPADHAEQRSLMLKSLQDAGMGQSEIDAMMAQYDSAIGGVA